MKLPALPLFPAYATPLDKAGWWAVRAACAGVLAFLLLPILVIIPLSFSDSSFLAYPIPGWSLKWYQNLFTSAKVPSTVAITVAAGATMKLFFAARPHSSDVNRLWYHCSDQPGIG